MAICGEPVGRTFNHFAGLRGSDSGSSGFRPAALWRQRQIDAYI